MGALLLGLGGCLHALGQKPSSADSALDHASGRRILFGKPPAPVQDNWSPWSGYD
jgi:hypothetical protein